MNTQVDTIIIMTFLTCLRSCSALNCFDCIYYEGVPEYDHHSVRNQCLNLKLPQPKNKPPNDTDLVVKAVLCPPQYKSCMLQIGVHKTKRTKILIRGCSNETFIGCRSCGNGDVDECTPSFIYQRSKTGGGGGHQRSGRMKLAKNDWESMARGSNVVQADQDIKRQKQCFCQSDRCNSQPSLIPRGAPAFTTVSLFTLLLSYFYPISILVVQ